MNTSVTYLGLPLRNPIVVSSCGLTSTVAGVKQAEEAGAGAVVLKSIFEEQIEAEAGDLHMADAYPEAADFLNYYVRQSKLDNYLQLIADARKTCTIPVIASINCLQGGDWTSFARKVESAGASAIELNIYFLPNDKSLSPDVVEKRYYDIAAQVVAAVKIPVSVKIPDKFTNPLYTVDQLYYRGVKGVVLYNRLYQPDIDVKALEIKPGRIFTTAEDLHSLRDLAQVSSHIAPIDLAASTGVHSAEQLIKVLLAGAKTAQVCSLLYADGFEAIGRLIARLEEFMRVNSFATIDDFRASLNKRYADDPTLWERTQFMKYFSMH